jgi:hypothetical protein
MLATTGSDEINEWIAELTVLRPEDEKEAYKKAKEDAKRDRP